MPSNLPWQTLPVDWIQSLHNQVSYPVRCNNIECNNTRSKTTMLERHKTHFCKNQISKELWEPSLLIHKKQFYQLCKELSALFKEQLFLIYLYTSCPSKKIEVKIAQTSNKLQQKFENNFTLWNTNKTSYKN